MAISEKKSFSEILKKYSSRTKKLILHSAKRMKHLVALSRYDLTILPNTYGLEKKDLMKI